jgi:hypothetical protein
MSWLSLERVTRASSTASTPSRSITAWSTTTTTSPSCAGPSRSCGTRTSRACDAIKADATPYQLVIVDTVARVLPGVDMNEQQTVTMFMERIGVIGALTGAATIGVHHQNKTGGMMGSTFFRGQRRLRF